METIVTLPFEQNIFNEIRAEVVKARNSAAIAVNAAMVNAYWNVGRLIVEAQGGSERSDYGDKLINTFFYKRLLACRDKEGIKAELKVKDPEDFNPRQIIRDPYVLEFLDLKAPSSFYENNLEEGLISHLQDFLLELGRGFTFVGRQKRITFD